MNHSSATRHTVLSSQAVTIVSCQIMTGCFFPRKRKKDESNSKCGANEQEQNLQTDNNHTITTKNCCQKQRWPRFCPVNFHDVLYQKNIPLWVSGNTELSHTHFDSERLTNKRVFYHSSIRAASLNVCVCGWAKANVHSVFEIRCSNSREFSKLQNWLYRAAVPLNKPKPKPKKEQHWTR